MLGDDVALFVEDEHHGDLTRAARGEQANGVGGGAVFKHGCFGRTVTCGVKGDGVCTAALIEVFDRLIVPSTVCEDFQRLARGIGRGMPILHFLLDVFLNKVAITAIPGHQIENDDTSTVVVEVEPARFIDKTRFNISVERFVNDVGDRSRFCVGLKQLIHAVKHGERSEGNRAEHHDGNGKSLPGVFLLENTPIGLVKQAHTEN